MCSEVAMKCDASVANVSFIEHGEWDRHTIRAPFRRCFGEAGGVDGVKQKVTRTASRRRERGSANQLRLLCHSTKVFTSSGRDTHGGAGRGWVSWWERVKMRPHRDIEATHLWPQSHTQQLTPSTWLDDE